MIDAMTALATVSVLSLAGNVGLALLAQSRKADRDDARDYGQTLYLRNAALLTANGELTAKVEAFEAKEAANRARMKRISALGHAVQSAKAAERHKLAEEVKVNTLAAVASTAIPPREQVVAGVRENRPRRRAKAA